jgi:hypothetical protein
VWWLGSVAIVAVVGIFVGSSQSLHDFTRGYYYAGRNILNDNILLDPRQLYPLEYCTEAYANFPLFAYIFVPFKFFSEKVAIQIFYMIGYVSILPLAYGLIKVAGLNGWKSWLMLGLLMINGPLVYSMWLGNITQFIMISMLLALWWLKQGKELLSGILLGINGLIKIPLALPAGYFFIRRRWNVVLGGALVIGLILGLSLLLPFSLNKMWLDKCILSSAGHPIAAHNNQSVVGMLARQLIPGSDVEYWLPINPTPDFNLWSKILVALLYLPAIIVLIFNGRSSRTSNGYVLEFFIVVTCSFLTSPISWVHYLALLLIPVAFYLKDAVFDLRKLWLNGLFGFSLVFLSIPVDLTFKLFESTDQRMFLSLHFVGCVLFYMFLLVLWYSKRYGLSSHLLDSRQSFS